MSTSTLGCDDLKTHDTLRPSYERPRAASKPQGEATADWACNARLREGKLTLAPQVAALTVTDKGLVHVADVGVLGGPFEPPLKAQVAGSRPTRGRVRLLVDKDGLGHCARLDFTSGEADGPFPASAKETRVGEVVIDSGTVVFADAARVTPWLAHQPGELFVGLEGPEGELPALAQTLANTIPMERVLPTYFRATRPLSPTDLDTAKQAIHAASSHARASVEPRPAAWALVATLGDRKLASDDHAGETSAALVDVPAGDGAYVVTATRDDAGALLGLTVSLER